MRINFIFLEMPCDLANWRLRIGTFDSHFLKPPLKLFSPFDFYFTFLFYLFILFSFLICSESLLMQNMLHSYEFHHYMTNFLDVFPISIILYIYLYQLIYQCGDISRNPGPQSDFNLKVCHWNIGSVVVRRFEKLSLLKAYNAIHNFDIICLSETFLDSSYSSKDHDLTLDSYKLI